MAIVQCCYFGCTDVEKVLPTAAMKFVRYKAMLVKYQQKRASEGNKKERAGR